MVTHMLLIKKLDFKIVEDQKIASQLSESNFGLKEQGALTDEEFVHLIRLQVSN